jgi:hypothetical protein
MVSSARSLKATSLGAEDLLDFRCVTGHQKARTSLSSCWYRT